jgi:aminopeptidase N
MRNSVLNGSARALIACALLIGTARAQFVDIAPAGKDSKGFLRIAERSAGSPVYAGPHPFDMLHYRIDLQLPLTTEQLLGRSTMTLVITAPTDTLMLNAVQLSLDTVRINGSGIPFRSDASRETFTILLGTTRSPGDTLTVAVDYRRIPGLLRPADRLGYYWYTPSADPVALDTIGYTMSEPSDARFWLPCFDDPSDKATAEIHATVPRTFVAASIGRLLGVSNNPDGSATWHWQENHPVATYLLCVTASKFTVSSLPYARATGDTVPLQYYVWAPDSAACAAYLPTVRQMVQNLSSLFRPYPFDKYGMTAVAPFGFGGMEHQTITTLARNAATSRGVVVHELAHQWFGDALTCGTWKDIWLNESFATYSEALWEESVGGQTALRSAMKAKLRFGTSWNYAVYDPTGQGQYIFADLVYSKGAWVLQTLRGILGDSTFFRSLRDYLNQSWMNSVVTSEFQASVEKTAGTSLAWFFNEWIYGKGWPVYAYTSSFFGDSLSLRIYQQQNPAWPTFKMPVQLRAFKNGKDTTFTLWDSLRVQSYRIPFPFAPDSVQFDPDLWIMKQMTVPPASADAPEGGIPDRFGLEQNYPNPFNPTTVIVGQWPAAADVSLIVYDLLGREVARMADGRYPAGRFRFTFDASRLPSGVYLYRLSAGPFTAVRRMVFVK